MTRVSGIYVTPEDRVVSIVRDAVPETEEIWLYGSRRRGDFRPDSDYDVLVVVPDGTDLDEKQLWNRLENEPGTPIDARFVERSNVDTDLFASIIVNGVDLEGEYDDDAIEFHRGRKIYP